MPEIYGDPIVYDKHRDVATLVPRILYHLSLIGIDPEEPSHPVYDPHPTRAIYALSMAMKEELPTFPKSVSTEHLIDMLVTLLDALPDDVAAITPSDVRYGLKSGPVHRWIYYGHKGHDDDRLSVAAVMTNRAVDLVRNEELPTSKQAYWGMRCRLHVMAIVMIVQLVTELARVDPVWMPCRKTAMARYREMWRTYRW